MLKVFRYVLGYLYLILMGIAVFIVAAVFCRKNRIIWKALRGFFYVLLKIWGIELEVENKHLYKNGPGIIVANHQSYIDSLFIPKISPVGTVTIGKKSIAYIPFFGWAYFLMGNILVNRNSKKESRVSLAKVLKFLHKTKDMVLFFPEGTRNYGGPLRPFKRGAFYLAAKHNLPIYPVAITNIKNIDLSKTKSKMTARIFPPLLGTDPDELKNKAYSLINNYVYGTVE